VIAPEKVASGERSRVVSDIPATLLIALGWVMLALLSLAITLIAVLTIYSLGRSANANTHSG
jgi:hypothetical protein